MNSIWYLVFSFVLHTASLIGMEDPISNYTKVDYNLFEATQKGDLQEVEKLILNGANVNAFVSLGAIKNATPLHIAALSGHLILVHYLLQHGASINAQDGKGTTPLRLATLNQHLDVVLLLLDHGADINTSGTEEPPLVIINILIGYAAIAKEFLKRVAKCSMITQKLLEPILAQGAFKDQPLVIAALFGDLFQIKNLIPQSSSSDIQEALEYAVAQGHKDAALYLLSFECDKEKLIALIDSLIKTQSLDPEDQLQYLIIRNQLIYRSSLKIQILQRFTKKLKDSNTRLPQELITEVNAISLVAFPVKSKEA
jgi:ankyrin repeat protein